MGSRPQASRRGPRRESRRKPAADPAAVAIAVAAAFDQPIVAELADDAAYNPEPPPVADDWRSRARRISCAAFV